jgi:nitrate/nitrite transporter NarK
MWYKVFMLIAVPALIVGWIAYVLWMRKVQEEEKNQPKPESQRLQKTKSEISDWAQKMAQYKPPPRKTFDDEPEQSGQDKPDKTE